MEGCAKTIDWVTVPDRISPFISQSQTFVTPGKLYPFYATSVYDHVVFVLIVDDLSTPVFVPAWLFEVTSTEVPSDWVLNLTAGDKVDLILGPQFIARDLTAYNALVDQETEALEQFWTYARSRNDLTPLEQTEK